MDLFSRIAHFYDRIIKDFNFDTIRDHLILNDNELLLDLGGGTGRVSKSIIKHVNECVVLDRSFEMLQQAKLTSKSLMLVQGLAENQPFRPAFTEQVFVNDVLHHIRKQSKTLEETHRIMKDKGLMFIREYDRKYFWNFLLILMEKILLFRSIFLAPEELEEMCEIAGFSANWIRLSKATYLLTATK